MGYSSRCWSFFLLLTANFQSLRLALSIVLTIPAVLCGVLLMLVATGTTLNVQSFMGAIMSIGIAVANSILLVSFAERFRHEGHSVLEAAREGAGSRLRAILMTAFAMMFGHGADGHRLGRRWSAIGPAGPRGDRWPDRLHIYNAPGLTLYLHDAPTRSRYKFSVP